MEVLLLGIYSFFVWLIFIKFKWLPWNTVSQVTVAIIPIVALTVLILTLNVVAPSSADVRVFKYTVPIVSQVRGRVIEVPVEEGNRLVKKGDVLFKVDPTPYQLTVNSLMAQLVGAKGGNEQLREQLRSAEGNTAAIRSRIALMQTRVQQNRELAATGAGNRFDLEQAETDLRDLESQMSTAMANEAQVRVQLSATVGGDIASVAKIKADLANAEWELQQTTVRSPCDCYVINLALRPGAFVAGMPFNPVMTLVESEGQVVALFNQNELHQIKPGNYAEFSLKTNPGRIVRAKVDSIIWAQGMGQMQQSGTLPMTGVLAAPPNRFAVKFDIEEADRDLLVAAGAAGHAAVYTDSAKAIHILRMVILRVGAYTDYLVLKLH
ncbi:MAG: HlyD family secretion protein [Gammaproteobacteria bacterium]|jgi:multidrug resistance efflux pump|nr:HlyD family secretion protein [Gammaproteobacteria bacterium]MDH5225939.1 HlyD family secretion protein [Gammaproteobacteria bacterium]